MFLVVLVTIADKVIRKNELKRFIVIKTKYYLNIESEIILYQMAKV